MMTVLGPPPPPPTTLETVADSVQALSAKLRAAALEIEQRKMGDEIEKLQAQVKVLEENRQWWRRWHLKWGPLFRRWRDGNNQSIESE